MDPYWAPVEAFLDALNAHDFQDLGAALAPDFMFEEVAGAGKPSIEALIHEMRMIVTAFPDITFRPVRRSNEGSRTHLEFRAIGTHQGVFLDVPATGSMVIVSGVFNLESNGNLVRRLRLTVDFGGLRRQLLTAARIQ